jgi:3-hydroxybutyryl-CoA dehydrogenase
MEISRVAVVGAGLMGSEIAQVMAAGGRQVLMVDIDDAALAKGVERIRKIGERRVSRGRMTEEEAAAIMGRVETASDFARMGDCDLAIEAVPEIMDLKRTLFRKMDAALPDGALLASNTSGLSITDLAGETGRPDKVLGLHFFNPASVMALVEVIDGSTTSPETADAGQRLVDELGKTPVRVKECPGFLVNRILVRAMAAAYKAAADNGIAYADGDAATVAAGPAPMGPFALGDLVGLDTYAHIQKDLQEAYGDRYADAGLGAEQVAAGRLGGKTGTGFLAGEEAVEGDASKGRAVADAYYDAAVDEAERCKAEGIAAPDDIDVAMRLGTGWKEGPLSWDAGGRAPKAS